MSSRSTTRLTTLLVPWFIIAAIFLDYATGQRSCSGPDVRVGVCVPMLECESYRELLDVLPEGMLPSLTEALRNSPCGMVNNEYYACCDVTQYRGVITTPPPPDPSSIGLSTLQSLSCGTMENNRVATSADANLSEYPWMALLVYERVDLGCDGTLITEQHVLTSALCIRVPATRKLVAVRLGEHDISREIDCRDDDRECAPPVQEIRVAEAIIHEDYNSATLLNDIGILRLESKAVIHGSVIPICLPITDSSKGLPNRFVIAGWRNAQHRNRTAVLMKAPVALVDNVTCRSVYSTIPIIDKHVCAGGEVGVNTCMATTGAPLMYPMPHNTGVRMVQYGIVSYGHRMCRRSNYPIIYTQIEPYLQWITAKIATLGQPN